MTTPISQQPEQVLVEMAEAFLRWPMPESVCADLCSTKQQPGRVGTNLLSYVEALQMMTDVVRPHLYEIAKAKIEGLEHENTAAWSENDKLKAKIAALEAKLKDYEDEAGHEFVWNMVQKLSPWSESNDMPWSEEIACGLRGVESVIAALEKDAGRLNWLEQHWHDWHKFIAADSDGWSYRFTGSVWIESNVRTAIDKAKGPRE